MEVKWTTPGETEQATVPAAPQTEAITDSVRDELSKIAARSTGEAIGIFRGLDAIRRAFTNTATFGLGDEIAGIIDGVISQDKTIQEAIKQEERASKQAVNEFPILSAAGGVAGFASGGPGAIFNLGRTAVGKTGVRGFKKTLGQSAADAAAGIASASITELGETGAISTESLKGGLAGVVPGVNKIVRKTAMAAGKVTTPINQKIEKLLRNENSEKANRILSLIKKHPEVASKLSTSAGLGLLGSSLGLPEEVVYALVSAGALGRSISNTSKINNLRSQIAKLKQQKDPSKTSIKQGTAINQRIDQLEKEIGKFSSIRIPKPARKAALATFRKTLVNDLPDYARGDAEILIKLLEKEEPIQEKYKVNESSQPVNTEVGQPIKVDWNTPQPNTGQSKQKPGFNVEWKTPQGETK